MTLNHEVIDLTTLESTPWHNSAGRTRLITSRSTPSDGDGIGFLWRLSQAELEHDADFSALPGVDRVFTLLTSGPVLLHVEGRPRQVSQGQPQKFPGEAAVSIALPQDRPEKALNLMLARGRARGEVRLHRGSGGLDLESLTAAVVLEGAVTLSSGRAVGALEVILPAPRGPITAVPTADSGLQSWWTAPYEAAVVMTVHVSDV